MGLAKAASVAIWCLAIQGCQADPLTVPFETRGDLVALNVRIQDQPLVMLLDTGVDPSVVDRSTAAALGLSVAGPSGQAEGVGDDAGPDVTPTTLRNLGIGDRVIPEVEALAMDMAALQRGYGSNLHGILGHSFLNGRVVMIDYVGDTVSVLRQGSDAKPLTHGCRTTHAEPLRSFEGDTIPLISEFRFGDFTGPVSIDTGSNGFIGLFQVAADQLSDRLNVTGERQVSGARGRTTNSRAILNTPVGFGPFSLPSGQEVALRRDPGSTETRVANVGNRFFRALKVKILIDYPQAQITFYGDCPASLDNRP